MGQHHSNESDMHRRAKKINDDIEKLRKKGHNCLQIRETYPPQYSWCRQKICNHVTSTSSTASSTTMNANIF